MLITYRMLTPIGAKGNLLTLNFPIETSAPELDQNHVTVRHAFRPNTTGRNILLVIALLAATCQP